MPNKMLIDATHPEETRVVVVRGNRVEEFDFESAQRKQLRGNIYLAKVTRVEPSLQAAFIEYGGNRHGFLAFSEIHPDYYQIPVADRQALIEADERAHREAEEEIREPLQPPPLASPQFAPPGPWRSRAKRCRRRRTARSFAVRTTLPLKASRLKVRSAIMIPNTMTIMAASTRTTMTDTTMTITIMTTTPMMTTTMRRTPRTPRMAIFLLPRRLSVAPAGEPTHDAHH